jgi:hypothetical protein
VDLLPTREGSFGGEAARLAMLGIADVDEHSVGIAEHRSATPGLVLRLPDREGARFDCARERRVDVIDGELQLEPERNAVGLIPPEGLAEMPLYVPVRRKADARRQLSVRPVVIHVVALNADDALIEGE